MWLRRVTWMVAVDVTRTLVESVACAGVEDQVRDLRCCRDASHAPGGAVVASL